MKLISRVMTFKTLCFLCAAGVVALMAVFLFVLLQYSLPVFRHSGAAFFSESVWDPEPSHRKFGALAFIFGTLYTSGIALLAAVPLGLGAAIYLSEMAPAWLRSAGSFLIALLAAIPSVVYGFWGLFVLTPQLQEIYAWFGVSNNGGLGYLSAGIILAVMIVPYISAVSFDVCRSIPRSQREAALALGATRWQMIRSVVLSQGRAGILAACFIGLGRALGETMAVTMLIGNQAALNLSPFAMGSTIASVIANEFTEASYDLYLSALIALGLVLLLVTALVNGSGRFIMEFVAKRGYAPASTSRPGGFSHPVLRFNRHLIDRAAALLLTASLAAVLLPLLFIFWYLVAQGFSSLNLDFLTSLPAPVGEPGGGIANGIYGTVLLVGVATIFAVPLGLGAGIYLAEFENRRLGRGVRFTAELLAGVPSIVIGIFVYIVVVKPSGQFSGWAGSLALGIMMLPIVVKASEEALKLVPASLREGSIALGATVQQTIVRVVLPAALPGVVTAVLLAIARVAGETAPLLLTASSNFYWPQSMSDAMPSLPLYIFNYAISPYDEWHKQAWAAAFLLVALVTLVNGIVRIVAGKRPISV